MPGRPGAGARIQGQGKWGKGPPEGTQSPSQSSLPGKQGFSPERDSQNFCEIPEGPYRALGGQVSAAAGGREGGRADLRIASDSSCTTASLIEAGALTELGFLGL